MNCSGGVVHLAVTSHTIRTYVLLNKQKNMKIFQALGWGLFIVIIRNTMPEVFDGFKGTLSAFFTFANKIIESSPTSLNI